MALKVLQSAEDRSAKGEPLANPLLLDRAPELLTRLGQIAADEGLPANIKSTEDRHRAALWADVAHRKRAGHILPELAGWLLAMAFLLCLCAVLGSTARRQQVAGTEGGNAGAGSQAQPPRAGRMGMGADPPRDSRIAVLARWLSDEVQP